jgi:hypothetical protein
METEQRAAGLTKDKSTPENREYWDFVESTAAEVRTWPDWKTGRNTMEKDQAVLDQAAIERVERNLDGYGCRNAKELCCGRCKACLDNQATRRVLEAAKRPYALGDEERKALESLKCVLESYPKMKAGDSLTVTFQEEAFAALSAALNLAVPASTPSGIR